MMSSLSSELYLKSTSSVTLHERFTSIIMNKQPEQTHNATEMHPLQAASLKNQRLAQQMASWPSVLSALRNIPINIENKQNDEGTHGIKQLAKNPQTRICFDNKSLSQRIGTGNIKARLHRPVLRRGLRGRHWGRPGGRGDLLKRASSLRCMRGWQGVVSGVVNQDLIHPQYGAHIIRPGVMQHTRGRGPLRGRGRAWGDGRCWAESRPVPTREVLDEQLDEYMSMSKNHLDAQLDAYMAEVD